MISYAPFFKTLKEKNISQYKLIRDFGIDPAQLQRLRDDAVIKTVTIDRLCKILDCRVEDIMEYIKEND